MQMSESKVGTSKGSTSSTIKSSYSNSGNHSSAINNQVTSSANKNDSSLEQSKRTKKKANRDRQPANDERPAPAIMSNLPYSLIDDDHIDDQETINVGNLIIDLESDLEKEKIENEQANHVGTNNKPGNSAPSPTSLSTESDASGSSFTYRQRAARRRAHQPRSPTSMSPCSSSPINSTPTSPSSSNKPNYISSNNNNNNEIKASDDNLGSKPCGKIATKNANKPSKEPANINLATNISGASNNNGHTTTRTVFKSSSDERGELKMKITREKKTLKSEHKIVTSPTHKSPTGCSSSGNPAMDDRTGSHEDLKKSSSSSISSTKECGTSTSIGTITEPECLGPCEPGTSVTLEGIVWQETDGGILVVNVTWRGKTYVGALLDCTRHDWAPPRLCDSPASDIDLKANKGVRAKRIVTRSNGIGLDEKNLLQTTGKLRNGKGRRILPVNEPSSCNKKQRESSEKVPGDNSTAQSEVNDPNTSVNAKESDSVSMEVGNSLAAQEPPGAIFSEAEKAGPNSPMLIGCSEPNCSKKYRNLNGLQYHQSHAHASDSSPNNTHENCSSPTMDKTPHAAIDELPTHNLSSPNEAKQVMIDEHERETIPQPQQGQKRERTSSPELPIKHDKRTNNDQLMQPKLGETRLPRNDSPRISYVKGMDLERRHSSSGPSSHSNMHRVPEPARESPTIIQRHQSFETPHGQKLSHLPNNQHMSSPSLATLQAKSSSQVSKPSMQQQPHLPATTEEGMKPSGTSTGPPPAPHQANCYFNPAFLASTFNPYSMPPYFPRHLYDQITPPAIPTSNAAFLTRFMNNMRVPPPPDSPSRLLSPSMPKNVPFPPFKMDPGSMPPQLANSMQNMPNMPNMPPMSNPNLPPGPLPPMPPLSLAGGPSMRMPGDPLLPPSSQTPFLPPTGLNPILGLPGMGNPLGPMGGPPVPNPLDDSLAKQFPRRYN